MRRAAIPDVLLVERDASDVPVAMGSCRWSGPQG